MTLDPDAAALVGVDPHTGKIAPVGIEPPVGKPIPSETTAAELASLVGVSNNRGRELADRGVFVRVGRNRFDTRASVAAFVAELTRTAKRPVAADLDREKLRVARETADKLATANAVARRDLLPASEVERAWTAVLRDVRARMLAVPSRVGSRVATLTAHDVREIEREIRDALAEIADA